MIMICFVISYSTGIHISRGSTTMGIEFDRNIHVCWQACWNMKNKCGDEGESTQPVEKNKFRK